MCYMTLCTEGRFGKASGRQTSLGYFCFVARCLKQWRSLKSTANANPIASAFVSFLSHRHLSYKGYKGYKKKAFSQEVRLLACS